MNDLTELADIFASLDNTEEMEQLMNELFTENELSALVLRWELMKKLKKGKTQRAIASELHVSLCKVTRGNKILKDTNSVSGKILERLYGNE